jgi:nitrogen fixation-related uncharacterized protein
MWQLFSPVSVIFAGVGILLSVCIVYIFMWAIVTYAFQTAKDVQASQDTLVDIFERIEMFF